MVVEIVPLIKGGIGSIFHPTGSARTISGIFRGMTYLPIGGWTMPPTYHLLGEPETTTIDWLVRTEG